MSANVTTFEVRVKVINQSSKVYDTKHGCFSFASIVKMFHKDARTAKQAMNQCRKYGTPLSAHKVNVEAIQRDFSTFPIQNGVYCEGNPYGNAVAMDEMIWQKQIKKRDNFYKDKKGLDVDR